MLWLLCHCVLCHCGYFTEFMKRFILIEGVWTQMYYAKNCQRNETTSLLPQDTVVHKHRRSKSNLVVRNKQHGARGYWPAAGQETETEPFSNWRFINYTIGTAFALLYIRVIDLASIVIYLLPILPPTTIKTDKNDSWWYFMLYCFKQYVPCWL